MMNRIRNVFTALAVGDAMGMPTEFMTRKEIKEAFGVPDRLLLPEESQKHGNLPHATVTDDTEQNLWLYRLYLKEGHVDITQTANSLLDWAEVTGAAEKKYIGPSSLRALNAIKAGEDPNTAGIFGTTCGGIMRTPAAVLYKDHATEEELAEDIRSCLVCTHNTSEALEAAGAYGFALHAAMHGASMEEIIDAAARGGSMLFARAPFLGCAPSSVERMKLALKLSETMDDEALMDYVYDIMGAGLPSADVAGAAFAVFFAAKDDVWKAIRLSAGLGGDTDTVAALAGALCAAYAGKLNIPAEIIEKVFAANPVLCGAPWEN